MSAGGAKACAWCGAPIPAAARRDARTCSKACRQARSRFGLTVGKASPVTSGVTLRFAYADPPYPGKSRRYYGEHRDYAGEVDHAALIRRLDPYDGWALSTSAAALPDVLALCPRGVRVAAWHRGARPNVKPVIVNAWEPVIYFAARWTKPDLSSVDGRQIELSSAAAVDVLASRATTAAVDASRAPGEASRL